MACGCKTPIPNCEATAVSCAEQCPCAYVEVAELLPEMQSTGAKLGDELIAQLALKLQEASSLFEARVAAASGYEIRPGYFNRATAVTTREFIVDGSNRYLFVPHHVRGSVEWIHRNGECMDVAEFRDADEYLIYGGCDPRNDVCPASTCVTCSDVAPLVRPLPLPQGCYCIAAKWGFDCVPADVKLAVKARALDAFRRRDPAWLAQLGLANITRAATDAPLDWTETIDAWATRLARRRQPAW